MAEETPDLYEKSKGMPSKIRIVGGPNNLAYGEGDELDVLDANTIETFTLEEFKTIVLDCRSKNKDFIIARVTTPDPEDQSIIYNFYYAASELNRILFRFESDRRLLHRMKVRNPLNNMYILGQVYYYKVPPQEVDRALVEYFFVEAKPGNRAAKKAFSQVFRHNLEEASEDGKRCYKSRDYLNGNGRTLKISSVGENPREVIEKIQKGTIAIPKAIPPERSVVYIANYFASDDDFLMQPEVREYFRRNTLDADDDFLFEIDRTQNDFFALLETASEDENEEVLGWKRVLTAHVSMLVTLLTVCLVLGVGPQMVLVALPLAVVLIFSFIGSIFYILFCRRNTFDTLAVNSVEEV
ncbi:hypothetical protein [Encephalitozoon cuniculi GB-M1]|uniref:Golgi protein n=2 Tax=Encephalitozoon cuniculi TaxID=6035 RepID=Q8SUR2_ENCCU|nr:uncharacterized protein ECU08_0720 [Encephalitozoon cuniculi GB-M1]AGE95073.1 hypothetical protein ECU08_0720 [Encephalitozoon cuniculi]KMV65600.1 hypothetical protein M970_080730 [Encephalitozoon cuniculi EcunIII-L]UYI27002.1 DUF5092 domain-containing protein [Encephalitozoon cuniculi]CAD26377.1 hypothetical protein [Encephalitozoon cuniculi GB-M1]